MPRGNLMKHFETDFQRSDINQIIPSGSRLAVCKGEGQPSQSKLYHVLTLLPKSRRIALAMGSGADAYEKGKTALQTWRHFGLSWAFVDPKTPIENGVKFCACVKEFFPWLRMPLQVVYVNETRNPKLVVSSFGFGGGTLRGHLLVCVYFLSSFCMCNVFI
ncbi:unnamed protein product [Lactuca virosa]|uniref:DUF1990 domain-containing protein n=1 Tax=Lactuca virosa TaxID=75947 RepID=A0AAU9NH03_9ASTR|nr:unnamed protein product [Lactuca virosa]